VRIVRHHDDGPALFSIQRLQQAQDFIAGFAIQIAGRFVAEQDGWISHNGAGDADALLFAPGQRARKMFGAMRQAKQGFAQHHRVAQIHQDRLRLPHGLDGPLLRSLHRLDRRHAQIEAADDDATTVQNGVTIPFRLEISGEGKNAVGTLFNGEELTQFIKQAEYVVVNDYEFQLLKERTGLDGTAIAEQVEALIVTRGAEGSVLRTRDGLTEIGAVEPDDILDPTGCGDAFRAGLIHGLLNDLDLVTCCRIGSVMGAIKVARQGPQNHKPSFGEIQQRFLDAYGYRF